MTTIVYIYHSLSSYGGIERVLADKMNYLAEHYKEEFSIHFVTKEQNNDSFSYPLSPLVHHKDLGGMRYHAIYHTRYPMRLRAIHKFEKDFKQRLRQYLEEVKPQIIIANTSFCVNLIAQLNYPCAKVCETHIALPFILKAGPKHTYLNKLEYALKTLYDKRTLHMMNHYDALVTVTQEDAEAWSKHRPAICIYNPITQFPETTTTTHNHRIVMAGRMYAQKGYDLLIKAWQKIMPRHPSWSIHIYGDGNERPLYEQMIKERHLESSIILHGGVDNIYDKYSEGAFLVLSSRCEGFGLVLAENMSCSRPCVAFNCPYGPSEIITDGVDGLLVKNGDVNELAQKMEWMITHPAEREEMGRKARVSAQRFKKEIIMEQWAELFRKLAQKYPS